MEKTAIVLVGPITSGKTTYAEENIPENGVLVSYEKIAIGLYGKKRFDFHHEALEEMNVRDRFWETVASEMSQKDVIILDIWNADAQGRSRTISRLKGFGFDKIICWFFVTHPERCVAWNQQKNPGKLESACIIEFKRFHKDAYKIKSEGFDEVQEIKIKLKQ